jgi:hypothetical protein
MNPQPFDIASLAEIRVQPAGDKTALIFVRELRHDIERVWRALTDPRSSTAGRRSIPIAISARPVPRRCRWPARRDR